MKWIGIALWCIAFNFILVVSKTNNVCDTLWDYRTIRTNQNCRYNPNVKSSTKEIAKRYGFIAEQHDLKTSDGYMLRLYRIYRNISDLSVQRQPVLLQSGIGGTTEFWILRGEDALPFQLYDQGYDVWLSAVRGSILNSTNEALSKDDPKYWDFSFHEFGYIDLPMMLDVIKSITQYPDKVIYIGHSMGTTLSYVYAIERQEHAEKSLKGIVSLAPVVYLKTIDPLLKLGGSFADVLYLLLRLVNIYAIGQDGWFRNLFYSFCSQYPGIIPCDLMNGRQLGASLIQDRPDLLPVFFSYFPSPICVKILMHYAQFIQTEKFQWYDYGTSKNLEVYHAVDPPLYDIEKISVPVHFFLGDIDSIASIKDNNEIYTTLRKRGVKTSRRVYKNYAHNDFFLAKHYKMFSKDLLNLLDTMRNKNKTI